ncbi:MAG TPA: LacI family DNA-binding transcriptional regulator [Hanamia sp.]
MPKEKEVTIYDIASTLNVSIATVSRAFKNEPVVSKRTKKRIFNLFEEMGYLTNSFARNLRNHTIKIIGVIVHEHDIIGTSTMAGIEKVAAVVRI